MINRLLNHESCPLKVTAILNLDRMHALLRRKYRTVVLLLVVAVLFYLLQCFAVSRLGNLELNEEHSQKMLKIKHDQSDDIIASLEKDILHNEEVRKKLTEDNIFVKHQNKTAFDLYEGKNKLLSVTTSHPLFDYDNVQHKNKNEMAKYKIQRQAIQLTHERKQSLCNIAKSQNLTIMDSESCFLAASSQLIGVLDSNRHLYQANEKNMFTCLSGAKIQIPRHKVNDDYCDCPDSSDEPGTSACPNSKFYCTKQIPKLSPQFVTPSKVNDGICDCCDGSDEWLGLSVPDFMKIEEGEPMGAVYHTPCPDKCDEIQALQNSEDIIRAKGKEIQKDYISMAQLELSQSQKQIYGAQGVFYPLSKQCYKLKVHPYEYNVCPFVKVSQEIYPHSPVVLGRQPTLLVEQGYYVLVMDGGDDHLCPFGRARRSKIYLVCGLQDRLMQVAESEVCEYSFTMSSPAAC